MKTNKTTFGTILFPSEQRPPPYLSRDFNADLIKHLIDNCLLFLLIT